MAGRRCPALNQPDPGAFAAWVAAVLDRAGPAGGGRAAEDTDEVWAGPFPLRVRAPGGRETDAGRLDPGALRAAPGRVQVRPLHLGLLDASDLALPRLPPIPGDHRWHLADGTVEALVGDSGLGWVIDTGRGVAARVRLEGADVPVWEHVAPLRHVLAWWAAANGSALVHAAALALDGKAVLLVGKGGAGKSTTSLAAREAGWTLLGDDYAIVAPGPPPVVHALYGQAKADDTSAGLARVAASARTGVFVHQKHVVALDPIAPDEASAEVVAVCAMQPLDPPVDTARLEPLPSIAIARALAPSTLKQQVGAWEATWKVVAGVAKSVPGYGLAAGADPVAAARLLKDVLP